jgi:HAE1 family hydrophobic/amphiphilic exporter-1
MKIIDLSIRRKVTIAMFTIGILLFGIVSLTRLNVNLLPELSYPTLTIRTAFEGAAPAEVENLITIPIEEAVGVVKGVQQIRSISRTGQSDVVLEFAWGTDMNIANLDVISELEAVQLPIEAQKPVTLRFDPSLDPIIRYALFYEDTAKPVTDENARIFHSSFNKLTNQDAISRLKSLRILADEEIKKNLESSTGVASVKVSGGLEDEIQVLIDQHRLSYLNIPIENVSQILSAENVNLSGGRLEEGVHQYLIRTLNEFQDIDQIRNVVLTGNSQNTVYLKDVATVEQAFKEREAITRLNGMEAVEIAILKEGDANTVATAKTVQERMEEISSTLPDNMKLEMVYDQSEFIISAVNEVRTAGIIGGILAILVLYLFLRNFWATIIISVSIPVSIIATFNLMYAYDISLNIMSLGGIVLGLGMLVDNAIVVLENIARHREIGKGIVESVREGAGEVGMAVTASTFTTIAVFFPLVFVHGIAGQLFRDQALTVTFSLLVSLVVALTLIPMMSSIVKSKQDVEPAGFKEPRTKTGRILRKIRILISYKIPTFITRIVRFITRWISKIIKTLFAPFVYLFEKGYEATETVYARMLRWALNYKFTVLTLAVLIFAGSLALVPRIGVELMPQVSQGEFSVEFQLPPGTPIEATDAALKTIQTSAQSLKGIDRTFAVSGIGNRMDANPEQGGENRGELNVSLISGSSRADEERVMANLRSSLEQIPGLQYTFERPTLFTFNTPVEIEISEFELDKLKEAGNAVARKLEAGNRFTDVQSSMETGSPEVQILFDRDRAAALGLQVHEIADRVVRNVRGDLATRYTLRDRKIDVLVRAREADRASIEDLRRLIVNPGSDRPVPLSAVATIQIANGPSEIRRVGQQRTVVVSANLNYGDLGDAAEEIEQILLDISLPAGIYANITGQNEEMSDSFRSMLFALALSVFLVYLVMASQFESLLHPFIILFTIPLALAGVILGLYITGSTISVVVFIGLILLAGIVVNNAIILIDLINQMRTKGMEKIEAIREGAKSRLRPILMTTITTTLALLPLAIGFGDGGELRAPMGITVIGGLLVSTLLTLIVIPVMYDLLDRKKYDVPSPTETI